MKLLLLIANKLNQRRRRDGGGEWACQLVCGCVGWGAAASHECGVGSGGKGF